MGICVEAAVVSDRTGWGALRVALANWRLHVGALAVIASAFAVAHWVVGSPSARYAAILVAFAVWMAWFVLTAVEWIRHADF